MRVVSTNIGERKTVKWKYKTFTTGIFKEPRPDGIYLETADVQNDVVFDRKFHGGLEKACYLYSLDHYDYWKQKYPVLNWHLGMFGENLTVEGFDEKEVSIGDTFQIGDSIVQVSEARQPCSTLNMRFQSSKMIKDFIAFGYCGAYFRVLQKGLVVSGDQLMLIDRVANSTSLYDLFKLLYDKNADHELIRSTIDNPSLGIACKDNVRKFHQVF